MAKKYIKQVIIHNSNSPTHPHPPTPTCVTAFYADIIRRRLANSTLSKEAKLKVLDSVTVILKKRIT